MAKFTIPTLLLTALLGISSLGAAQTYNQSDPFILQLSSDNETISGQVLDACHSGAALEELCLAGTDATPTPYNTFTFNVSSTAYVAPGQYPQGLLVWVLQGSNFNESEPLSWGSVPLDTNVIAPLFEPTNAVASLAFDDDDKLFVYSDYYDDRNFTAGQYPTQITPVPLYQWYSCWTYSLSYYYNTLAWVTSGEPQNPTCQAVNVTRIFV